jgi:hypothetical protein
MEQLELQLPVIASVIKPHRDMNQPETHRPFPNRTHGPSLFPLHNGRGSFRQIIKNIDEKPLLTY